MARAIRSLHGDPGRAAVIGAGAFGRFCIDSYRSSGDIDVLGVADPDTAALSLVEAPEARLLADWRVVMADDAVEVVHVATPPWLRSDVIDAALSAGKSVFCEKPLALTLREADEMIAAAGRQGVALGVNYVMRHLPAYKLLERLASSRLLGRPRSLSFHNFAQHVPPDHWFWDEERSGGILVEHAVHFFDVYARVMGTTVEASGSAPRPEAVDVLLRHADGGLSRHYHEFAFPKEVEHAAGTTMFEKGHVVIEGWIPTRLWGAGMTPNDGMLAVLREFGAGVTTSAEVVHFSLDFPDREDTYRKAIVAGMRDVVHRHRDPHHQMEVTPQDARASLAVALACRTAIQKGTVVPAEA